MFPEQPRIIDGNFTEKKNTKREEKKYQVVFRFVSPHLKAGGE